LTVSNREAARRWDCSYHTAKKRRDAGEVPPDPDQTGPHFLDLPDVDHQDPEAIADAAAALRSEILKRDIRQAEVTIRIGDGLPAGVAWRADLHTGSLRTDLHAILRHNRIIRDTPGLYTGFAGDSWDNYGSSPNKRTGQHEAILPEEMQIAFVEESCLKYLRGKTLFFEDGCHEAWTFAATGTKPVKWLVRQLSGKGIKCAYLGHGGRINLLVGKQKYIIDTRHKGRGKSILHIFQSIFRSFKDDSDYEDLPHVTCHAHTHDSGHFKMFFRARWRVGLKPGSYKPTDDYGQKGGWAQTRPSMPVTIFYPDHDNIIVIDDIEAGARFLTAERERMSRLRNGVSA